MSETMFSKEFLATGSGEIAAAIKRDGFFSLQGALTPAFVDAIKADVAETGFGLNRNWITGVYADRQYYLTHMMAASQAYVDLVTDDTLHAVYRKVLGPDFRLKAQRYYETFGGHHMQWHTDNKTDREFADIPGLIVIAYISDVADGEFQYVRGSQAWSGEKAYNNYEDAFIAEKYAADIVSFTGPAGTMVIYDTYGIHRARPVTNSDFIRKSLFFQTDTEVTAAEPILINPSYLTHLDAPMQRYLGFGLPTGYDIYPVTDLTTLPVDRLRDVGLGRWLRRRAALATPRPIKRGLKALVGR